MVTYSTHNCSLTFRLFICCNLLAPLLLLWVNMNAPEPLWRCKGRSWPTDDGPRSSPFLSCPTARGMADAGTTVGHAGGELVYVWGFVTTGESSGVVQAAFGVVGADVIHVSLCQPFNWLFNDPVKNREGLGTCPQPKCKTTHNLTQTEWKRILTSVHRPLAFPLYWNWCGSRHHSSSLR